MTPPVFVYETAGPGNFVQKALAEGIPGAQLVPTGALQKGVSVIWGILRGCSEILHLCRSHGLPYVYVDHAYFQRGHGGWYRLTYNREQAGPVVHRPPDRRQRLGVVLEPWRTGGRHILVCPPTQPVQAHLRLGHWLDETLETLKRCTDRPVFVRRKGAKEPLAEALRDAHALVAHASNAAVEAATLGVPVFVDPWSAAAPVAETDLRRIESPARPDREPWLRHLAYSQFHLDEIRDGTAWKILTEDQ